LGSQTSPTSTEQDWLYVAFTADVFARRIVSWRISSSIHTGFVLDALEQALYARQRERDSGLANHSGRGSQYVSEGCGERLAEAGIKPLAGSHWDRYDNALIRMTKGCTRPSSFVGAHFGRPRWRSNWLT